MKMKTKRCFFMGHHKIHAQFILKREQKQKTCIKGCIERLSGTFSMSNRKLNKEGVNYLPDRSPWRNKKSLEIYLFKA